MKILFICHNLTGGGAERVCVDVANGLSARGHDIAIMTDLKSPITYQPLSTVKLIQGAGCGRVKGRIFPLFHLWRYFKREHPDVVVSILYMYAEQAKIASLLTINCPIIVSDHNVFERPKYAKMKLRQRINKFWANYFFDGLTVLTEADKKYLNGRFKNVYVMPNPLSFTPLDKVPDKDNIVLAVGRLNAWEVKGFDLLIKGWRRIYKKYPEWDLRIVGHGDKPAMDYLCSLAEGIPNIEFVPYTPKILEEYRKASIFVLSSRYEGFGLALTEAMSQGCACIACDYKGRQAEIVTDGVNGLLCPTDDDKAIAERMDRLISDVQLREDIQKSAIKLLEKFSIERISQRWEKYSLSVKNNRK